MTPARTEKLNAAIAPFWERLKACLARARALAADIPEQASRAALGPLRCWIFVLESVLRRLVLIAATGVAVDGPSGWSRKTEEEAEPPQTKRARRRKRKKRKKEFKLYASRGRKRRRRSRRNRKRRTSKRTRRANIPRDTLIQPDTSGAPDPSPATPQGGDTAATTSHPIQGGRYPGPSAIPPDITVEELVAWGDAQTFTETSAQAAARQMKEVERANEHRSQAASRPPAKSQASTQADAQPREPETLSTTDMRAYLAHIAELIANPEPLIQRAARNMARARQIAYELSCVAAPKARGLLKTSPLIFSLLLPLHAGFSHALCLYALSYTETDTC